MQYFSHPTVLKIKKYFKNRYRFYAVAVMFLLLLLVQTDTVNAVKIVIPNDSLRYQVVSSDLVSQTVKEFKPDSGNEVFSIVYRGSEQVFLDKDGNVITDEGVINLYKNYGYALKRPTVIAASIKPDTTVQNDAPTLNDIIRAPSQVERKNFIEFADFEIRAPIIFTTANDIYEKGGDGKPDYQRPILENQEDARNGEHAGTPVLKLLREGAVLMSGIPTIPAPGELGNSYIVGHSANYASETSPYREIFNPLVDQTMDQLNGKSFYIWDSYGRKLQFKIIDSLLPKFDDEDVSYIAYGIDGKNLGRESPWKDRRIVTLQTCKTVFVSGSGYIPLFRRLIRAELVVQ
jgi:hypothetical protein